MKTVFFRDSQATVERGRSQSLGHLGPQPRLRSVCLLPDAQVGENPRRFLDVWAGDRTKAKWGRAKSSEAPSYFPIY